MARQGHRVWIARLGALMGVLVVAALAAWFAWDAITAADGNLKPQNQSSALSQPEPNAGSEEKTESKPAQAHALDPLLDFARAALKNHLREHRDYTANLVKHERIGTKLYPESKMALKLMYREPKTDKPEGASVSTTGDARKVSVYLKGVAPPAQAGREVIWIEGENDNKLKAHEAGMLGLVTVDLAPSSRLAMLGNRYSITEIGLEKLLRKLIERGEQDKRMGPATVRVTEDAVVANQKCRLLEVIHEQQSIQVDGKDMQFEFFLAQIYIDVDRQLPIRYAAYSWPKTEGGEPELLEQYTYEDLELNVGLTDADFDPKNSAYHF